MTGLVITFLLIYLIVAAVLNCCTWMEFADHSKAARSASNEYAAADYAHHALKTLRTIPLDFVWPVLLAGAVLRALWKVPSRFINNVKELQLLKEKVND